MKRLLAAGSICVFLFLGVIGCGGESMAGYQKIPAAEAKNMMDKGGVTVVSCPTCGRTQIDLISLAAKVEDMVKDMDMDIKVAVMGCAVNGPGEAREADIGIAGGNGEGLLIKKGEIIRKVPENEILAVLKEELERL